MTVNYNEEIAEYSKLQSIGTAQFSGIDADILMGGKGSPFTVMKMAVTCGMGSPAHISHAEDKVFCITEGDMLFLVGSRKFQVTAGDHIFVGKGIIHSFCGLSERDSVMTLVSAPGLHDQFFMELSSLNLPHVFEEVQSVCKRNHQEITGPVVQPQ